MKIFKATPEQKAFIVANVKGCSYVHMAEMVNKEFGSDVTPDQIKNFYSRNHLRNGTGGFFPKGHIPKNKGRKQTDYMSADAIERTKATRFQKGSIPHNHRPVGSERVDTEGFHLIKVAESKKWVLKHRLIWEQENGKIPKGYVVTFLDGNKDNISLDNLALISRALHVRLTQYEFRSCDKDATKAGIAIVKLKEKIHEKQTSRHAQHDVHGARTSER